MKFSQALLEMAEAYSDEYADSELVIEIKYGKNYMLVPFKIRMETEHEMEDGDSAVSIGLLDFSDEIREALISVKQLDHT